MSVYEKPSVYLHSHISLAPNRRNNHFHSVKYAFYQITNHSARISGMPRQNILLFFFI